MDIRKVDWQQHTWLLLEADPDMDMLRRYAVGGDAYGLHVDGAVVCIAIVVPVEGGYELKNIATAADMRGRGYAGSMIEHLCTAYAGHGCMYVGTADNGVSFYQRNGFRISHLIKNFFIDNYPEPIYDGGRQCVDMIYLCRDLQPAK